MSERVFAGSFDLAGSTYKLTFAPSQAGRASNELQLRGRLTVSVRGAGRAPGLGADNLGEHTRGHRRSADSPSGDHDGRRATPYLVSPAAEIFEPVPGVPLHAWLRAYNLERPIFAPAPLPDGLLPVKARPRQAVGARSGGRPRVPLAQSLGLLRQRRAVGAPRHLPHRRREGRAAHPGRRVPARQQAAGWRLRPGSSCPRWGRSEKTSRNRVQSRRPRSSFRARDAEEWCPSVPRPTRHCRSFPHRV